MLRDFPLSLSDLLDRSSEIVYGDAARSLVKGRRVLVTGGAGSIGSEIVRQLDRLEPEAVYLIDHDETALHSLQLQREGHGLLDDERIILADIRDAATMRRVVADVAPSLVFHVAAHKHLPLLQRYAGEGVRTNVLGTENVVAASVAAGVERLINVSTDKAALPTSVLGATKRAAETVVASYADAGTRVASVRFGNVLGSRGSLLHSLAFQIAAGTPVTLTDRRATRFFMTIPEAASLVIEAAVMAERGETYVLDMGDPVRIIDVIERFARLSGHAQPTIVETGLRPGEKLHEVLLDSAESKSPTQHPKIDVVRARDEVDTTWLDRLAELRQQVDAGVHPEELLSILDDLLPAKDPIGVP